MHPDGCDTAPITTARLNRALAAKEARSSEKKLRDELEACKALHRRIIAVKFTAVEFAARGQAGVKAAPPEERAINQDRLSLRSFASGKKPKARGRRSPPRAPLPAAPARLGRASPSTRALSIPLPQEMHVRSPTHFPPSPSPSIPQP